MIIETLYISDIISDTLTKRRVRIENEGEEVTAMCQPPLPHLDGDVLLASVRG